MTGLNVMNIINSADIAIKNIANQNTEKKIYPDYSEENVSDKIISIIQSYTHYINKKTWFRF